MTNPNTWLIRCGESGGGAEQCIMHDVVAVHYPITGDAVDRTVDEIINELADVADANDRTRVANELSSFIHDVNLGDLVLSPDTATGHKRYIVGIVQSDYEWRGEQPVAGSSHIRNVGWKNTIEWEEVPLQYRSIKYYNRSILHVDDASLEQAVAALVEDDLPKSDLLVRAAAQTPSRKAATPKTRASRKAVAKPLKVVTPTTRLCSGCHLQKRFAQFPAGSDVCVDCD